MNTDEDGNQRRELVSVPASIPTLLLPPRITDDSRAMAKAAARAGWDVERLASWHIPPLLADEDICVYAVPLFAIHASSHLGLSLIEPTYQWLTTLPFEYLHRDIRLMTMGEARSVADRRFIKCAAEKFFPARVYDSASALPSADQVSSAVPVLVIEPVAWDIEFRCFVLERKVVTMSPYLVNGNLAKNDEGLWIATDDEIEGMERFIKRFLDDGRVSIPPAVAIDVGRIQGQGWAVIEANPAWGSGLYGCDPDDALRMLRRSCMRTNSLMPGDQKWVIDHASEDFT